MRQVKKKGIGGITMRMTDKEYLEILKAAMRAMIEYEKLHNKDIEEDMKNV